METRRIPVKLQPPPSIPTEREQPGALRSTTFRLDGKTAVVTGGASGIGRAIADCFAAAGAHIRILDIDGRSAEKAVDEIISGGGKATAYSCDVSKAQDVQNTFRKLFRSERVNILVNNA